MSYTTSSQKRRKALEKLTAADKKALPQPQQSSNPLLETNLGLPKYYERIKAATGAL